MKRYILNITLLFATFILSTATAWGADISNNTEWSGNKSGSYVLKGTLKISGTVVVASGTTLTITTSGAQTIKASANINGPMFRVMAGGTLSITGTAGNIITIDGGARFTTNFDRVFNTDVNHQASKYYNTDGTSVDQASDTSSSGFTVREAIKSGGTLNLQYVTIENVKGTDNNGGGIWISGNTETTPNDNTKANGPATISNCTIKRCVSGDGSALHIDYHNSNRNGNANPETYKVSINDTTIENCYTTSTAGGTIRTNGGAGSNLYLTRVTVKNNFTSGSGGGIYWNAAGTASTKCTFNGCTFKNNIACNQGGAMMLETTYTFEGETTEICHNKVLSSTGYGGGIVVTSYGGGALKVLDPRQYTFNYNLSSSLNINNNVSAEGAGISFNFSRYDLNSDFSSDAANNSNTKVTTNITIDGATISNNTATNGNGGAIRIYNNTGNWEGNKRTLIYNVNVNSGTLSNNSAKGKGGAIYTYMADIKNTNTSGTVNINNNSATDNGGGIYVDGGKTISLKNVSIASNHAVNGGAIYLSSASNTEFTTTGTTSISNNYATGAGGAVYVNGGKVTLNAPTLSGNGINNGTVETDNGGAVYVTGTGSGFIANGTANITGNKSTTAGGAIYVSGGNVSLVTSKIESNSSASGGAIYVSGGSVTTTGTTSISNNYATGDGGAVYANGGKVTLNTPTLSGNGINSGTVETDNGGAVYVTGTGSGFIANGTANITGNKSTTAGGAIYVKGGDVTLAKNDIQSNSSKDGGAIYVSGGSVTIAGESANIQSNVATNDGGAIYVSGGSITTTGVTTATMNANYADNEGGVFFVSNGNIALGNTTMNGNGVSGNDVKTDNGGAIALKNGTFSLGDESVISQNKVTGFGGALYVNNAGSSEPSIQCTGGSFIDNEAKNGGAICARGKLNLNLSANVRNNKAENGGGLYIDGGVNMVFGNGLIVGNRAETTNTTSPQTASGKTADNVYGVGGGIFMGTGVSGRSTYLRFWDFENSKAPEEMGIYNNVATYAGADLCANGSYTKVDMPNITSMQLKDFDVPGNQLYWVEDYMTGDTGYITHVADNAATMLGTQAHRYEDALKDTKKQINRLIFNSDDKSAVIEVTRYACFDLGYDYVFLHLIKKGLEKGDDATFVFSSKRDHDEDPNTEDIWEPYTQVLFIGNGATDDVERIIGLPSGDWKIEESNWSYKYNELTYTSFTPNAANETEGGKSLFVFNVTRDGIKQYKDADANRTPPTDGNVKLEVTNTHKEQIGGDGGSSPAVNIKNINEYNHRKVNILKPTTGN